MNGCILDQENWQEHAKQCQPSTIHKVESFDECASLLLLSTPQRDDKPEANLPRLITNPAAWRKRW